MTVLSGTYQGCLKKFINVKEILKGHALKLMTKFDKGLLYFPVCILPGKMVVFQFSVSFTIELLIDMFVDFAEL